MKRFNISVPKEDKNGKAWWSNVGTLVRFDATAERPENFILDLHMFPTTKFGVFPMEEKKVEKELTEDEKFARDQKAKMTSPDPATGEEIDSSLIPF